MANLKQCLEKTCEGKEVTEEEVEELGKKLWTKTEGGWTKKPTNELSVLLFRPHKGLASWKCKDRGSATRKEYVNAGKKGGITKKITGLGGCIEDYAA